MSHQSKTDCSTRLRKLVEALITRRKFALADLKAIFPQESPGYITKLIRELQREGCLRIDEDKTFCWTCDEGEFRAETWLDRKASTPRLTQSPPADRPRERLLALGAAALRTAELLAILIRSGRPGESALQAGEKIAARYGEQLDRLPEAGRGDFKTVTAAVGETAYCQIMAGIELGRRVAQARNERQQGPRRIQGSDAAIGYCRERFLRLATDGTQEEFHVVCLDSKHQPLGTHRVGIGSLDRSLIHPREVFRPAIKDAAKAILLVHNHPSGDPTPSDEDLIVTTRLEDAGQTLGIHVLDHIIVARDGAMSVREFRSAPQKAGRER